MSHSTNSLQFIHALLRNQKLLQHKAQVRRTHCRRQYQEPPLPPPPAVINALPAAQTSPIVREETPLEETTHLVQATMPPTPTNTTPPARVKTFAGPRYRLPRPPKGLTLFLGDCSSRKRRPAPSVTMDVSDEE